MGCNHQNWQLDSRVGQDCNVANLSYDRLFRH